jgi:hypothetical protein
MKAIEDKISKLPKWAQDEFAMLHRRLADAKAEIASLTGAKPTGVYVERYGLDYPPHYLRENSHVTFDLESNSITCNRRGDVLQVRAREGVLLIEPSCANVVLISVRDRLESATRRKGDSMSETEISLDGAIEYLERPVATGGQNSEDGWEEYDQTACKIADLLRGLTRERDELQAQLLHTTEWNTQWLLGHKERLAEATAENTRLRAALANSKDPCAYCSLPKNEWSKCVKGFPGCDRADDAMGCPELGARLEADEATARVERAEAALAEFERRTRATSVCAEDQTKGASIYNWRMACLAEIRELSGFVRYLPQDHPDHPAVRDAAP